MLDAALFRLALEGKITLVEAKILKAIHENRACSLHALRLEIPNEKDELPNSLASLKQRGTIVEVAGFYLCQDFEGKIAEMVPDSAFKEENAVLVARN